MSQKILKVCGRHIWKLPDGEVRGVAQGPAVGLAPGNIPDQCDLRSRSSSGNLL